MKNTIISKGEVVINTKREPYSFWKEFKDGMLKVGLWEQYLKMLPKPPDFKKGGTL